MKPSQYLQVSAYCVYICRQFMLSAVFSHTDVVLQLHLCRHVTVILQELSALLDGKAADLRV